MAGTLTITGLMAGLPGGQNIAGPSTMTGLSIIGTTLDATLAAGDNTFAVPAGNVTPCAVWITFSQNPAATINLRTNANSSDAGLPIAPYLGNGNPSIILPLPAGVTTVILNASAAGAGVELRFI